MSNEWPNPFPNPTSQLVNESASQRTSADFCLNMPKDSRVLTAHLALLGANLFYGAGFTVAKTVMPRLIQPFGFILIRVAIVTLLFWLTAFAGPKYHTTIAKKDWPILVLGGLFG